MPVAGEQRLRAAAPRRVTETVAHGPAPPAWRSSSGVGAAGSGEATPRARRPPAASRALTLRAAQRQRRRPRHRARRIEPREPPRRDRAPGVGGRRVPMPAPLAQRRRPTIIRGASSCQPGPAERREQRLDRRLVARRHHPPRAVRRVGQVEPRALVDQPACAARPARRALSAAALASRAPGRARRYSRPGSRSASRACVSPIWPSIAGVAAPGAGERGERGELAAARMSP